MAEAYVIDAVRTPRGRGKPGKGALSGIHPQELLAQTLNRLAEKTGLDTSAVEDVVVGCVGQVNDQGANIARNAVLAAGWPLEVPAVSLNRFCGSGLQAVNFAVSGVAAGFQDLVVVAQPGTPVQVDETLEFRFSRFSGAEWTSVALVMKSIVFIPLH